MRDPQLVALCDLPLPARTRGFRTASDDGPVFKLPAERLFETWLAVAGRQPRTRALAVDPATRRSLHVQRSLMLRFPDLVRAQVVPLSAGRSGIIVDSRSRFGVFDFGVNRRRIEGWLSELAAVLERQSG
jgi:uncharacterized protein (DUF1499 family)